MGIDGIVLVRVVKVPAGEAPEAIRRQWIGAVFPGRLHSERCEERGINTGALVGPRPHYHVPAAVAIEALAARGQDEALAYFEEHLSRRERDGRRWFLTFGADEVKVLGTEP